MVRVFAPYVASEYSAVVWNIGTIGIIASAYASKYTPICRKGKQGARKSSPANINKIDRRIVMKYTKEEAQAKYPNVNFYGDCFYIRDGAFIGDGVFIGTVHARY